jgi:prepilin-type N-terminal cleavage/methylation domain-containing protein
MRRAAAGFTLVEVVVAIAVMAIAIFPLIDSIKHSRQTIKSSQVKRTMKQLLEFKMSQILLDQPPEDEEPIYVDGAEGNFGEEFEADRTKAYWFDAKYYNYSFRIDSQEVDLASAGGITGEEDESAREDEKDRAPEGSSDDPLGLGAGQEEEEELGQLRYLVTLTIFYRTGNPHADRAMTAVTYVKHPREKETMSGPDMGPAGAGGLPGGGEAKGGSGQVQNQNQGAGGLGALLGGQGGQKGK